MLRGRASILNPKSQIEVSHRCPAAVPTSVPSRKSLFSVGLPRFSTIFEKKVRHTCATELRKPFFLLGLHFPSPILPVGQGECGVRIGKCGGQKKNSCQLSAISFQPGRKFRISKIQTGSKCPVGNIFRDVAWIVNIFIYETKNLVASSKINQYITSHLECR